MDGTECFDDKLISCLGENKAFFQLSQQELGRWNLVLDCFFFTKWTVCKTSKCVCVCQIFSSVVDVLRMRIECQSINIHSLLALRHNLSDLRCYVNYVLIKLILLNFSLFV